MADYEVVLTEVRGQCEKGHVVTAEFYGPELAADWMDSCPLPECGHEIKWERRPEWMGPRPLIGAARLTEIIRKVDQEQDAVMAGPDVLAEAIVAELAKEG